VITACSWGKRPSFSVIPSNFFPLADILKIDLTRT
ncbi:MAG: hypothetical protein ACI860_000898, partial [Chitinophagales bacterium]